MNNKDIDLIIVEYSRSLALPANGIRLPKPGRMCISEKPLEIVSRNVTS